MALTSPLFGSWERFAGLARLMIDVMCSLDCSEVNPSDFRGQMTHSLGIVLILADLSLALGSLFWILRFDHLEFSSFILERMRIIRACYEVPRNKLVTGFGTKIVCTCHEVRDRKIHIAIARTCHELSTNLVRTLLSKNPPLVLLSIMSKQTTSIKASFFLFFGPDFRPNTLFLPWIDSCLSLNWLALSKLEALLLKFMWRHHVSTLFNPRRLIEK